MRMAGKEGAGQEAQGKKPAFEGPVSTPQKRLIDCTVVLISSSNNTFSVFMADLQDALRGRCKEMHVISYNSPHLDELLRDSDIAVFHYYGPEDQGAWSRVEKISQANPNLITVVLVSDPERVPVGQFAVVLDKYSTHAHAEVRAQIEQALATHE